MLDYCDVWAIFGYGTKILLSVPRLMLGVCDEYATGKEFNLFINAERQMSGKMNVDVLTPTSLIIIKKKKDGYSC